MNQPSEQTQATPADGEMSPCIVVPKGFTVEECDRIVEAGSRLESEPGVIDVAEIRHEIRRSNAAFFRPGPDIQWVYDRVIEMAAEVNRNTWKFALSGVEPMQFGRYDDEQHYGWHMDLGSGGKTALRKLTVLAQLSDPADYDGGEFEMLYGLPTVQAPPERGAVVMFPSYTIHQVLPVTRGTRYSLVAWVVGETPFR